jgi:hypothetical protein
MPMHPAIRTMRQFSPLTNLLLTCLAAAGLVLTLGLPWYGAAVGVSDSETEVGTIAGPIEGVAALVSRWFDPQGTGTTGADALGFAQQGLMGLAAVTALLAIAMLLPFARRTAQEGLRLIPLAAPALVVLQMVDVPVAGAELRWGAFMALLSGLFMASAAWHGAGLRVPARKPAIEYTPERSTPATAPASSVAPPTS